jgi:hypothetical protein
MPTAAALAAGGACMLHSLAIEEWILQSAAGIAAWRTNPNRLGKAQQAANEATGPPVRATDCYKQRVRQACSIGEDRPRAGATLHIVTTDGNGHAPDPGLRTLDTRRVTVTLRWAEQTRFDRQCPGAKRTHGTVTPPPPAGTLCACRPSVLSAGRGCCCAFARRGTRIGPTWNRSPSWSSPRSSRG